MALKIIYIAGYGRSGSTLLERILSQQPTVTGLGEMANAWLTLRGSTGQCSCGATCRECKIWGRVVSALANNSQDIGVEETVRWRHEGTLGLVPCLTRYGRKRKADYRTALNDLLRELENALGSHDVTVVDSSKTCRRTCWRALQLSRAEGVNVSVIHLVRDARGFMWSNLKGSNQRLEQGENARLAFPRLRTIFSWTLANLSAHVYQALWPGNYMRLRYEDLLQSPGDSLRSVGEFLGIDYSEEVGALDANVAIKGNAHQIQGNRMRHASEVYLRVDEEWRGKHGYRTLAVHALCWPLALAYGYISLPGKSGGS